MEMGIERENMETFAVWVLELTHCGPHLRLVVLTKAFICHEKKVTVYYFKIS